MDWETLSWLGASEVLRVNRDREDVWWYCSWTSHRGAQVVAEEPSSCPYNSFVLIPSFLSGQRFCFHLFSLFRDLGFCCQAGDAARWNCELDGVALHNSWKGWGMFSRSSFISYAFADCYELNSTNFKFFAFDYEITAVLVMFISVDNPNQWISFAYSSSFLVLLNWGGLS